MKRITILFVIVLLALSLPLCIGAKTGSSGTEDSSAVTDTAEAETSVSAASGGVVEDNALVAGNEVVAKAKDFAAYFEETIVPVVFIVVSSAVTLYLLIVPLITKVKNSAKKFKDATTVCEGVTATEEERINAMKEQISEIRTAFNEFVAGVNEAMKEIVTTSNANTEKVGEQVAEMARRVKEATDTYESIKEAQTIAFLNDENLVRKGYAKQIAVVLKGDGNGRKESEL